MNTIIFISIIAVFLYIGFRQSKKVKLQNEQSGYDYTQLVGLGNYISGHPDLNEPKEKVSFLLNRGKLELFHTPSDFKIVAPTYIASLDPSLIKDILVEDQSTFERRITVGRALLVGVFALIWKKKKKSELVYLTLKWNDGRFDHETIFEFEGLNTMTRANTARNTLIKIV